MKCLSLLTCIMAAAVASGPVDAQGTPTVPPAPPRAETAPRPARAPRAVQSFQWRSDELQAELAQRQRAMQDAQLERQQELEERQQERQESQLDRQREQERLRERAFDRDLTAPRAGSFDFIEPAPSMAPMPALAPRAWSDATMVPDSFDGEFLNRRPPAPWARGDPADSLYRVAREALNRGDYRRAAQLFNDLTRRYPQSNYAKALEARTTKHSRAIASVQLRS